MNVYLAANLAAWEARTPWHVRSAFYDVAGFKAGRETLGAVELKAFGEENGTYADLDAPIVARDCTWLHSMAEVVTSLCRAGIAIESLEEHPFVAWPMFDRMVPTGDGYWKMPEGAPDLPLSFSLTCVKPR